MSLFSVLMRPAPQSGHSKDFLSQLSVMGTYVRPSIKKDFVCCHPTQIFQVGMKEGQYACLLFFCIIIAFVCCSFFREGH